MPNIQFGAGNTKVLSLWAIRAGRLLPTIRDIYKELSEWRGGQLCLKVNFGLDLKGDIGARWPLKRGQREQSGQMHVTLRSDVGLFIYASSPEQSAELQTGKSNCPLTPSFGHLMNISNIA